MATEKQGSLQTIFSRIPSMRERNRRSSMGQHSGASALHEAIAKGKLHLSRFIIEATEERTLVNVKDSYGKTPLIRACKHVDRNTRIRAMELLIKHGADVNLKDNVGRTALSYACHLKYNDAVALLVKNNVDPNIEDNSSNTPLMYCAKCGNVGAIETIIRSFKRLGLDVDHINEEGLTPLMEAARNGYTECIKILIQNGKASLVLRDSFRNLNAEEWAQENGCNPETMAIFQKKKSSPLGRRHLESGQTEKDRHSINSSFDHGGSSDNTLPPETPTSNPVVWESMSELHYKQTSSKDDNGAGCSHPSPNFDCSIKITRERNSNVPVLVRRDKIMNTIEPKRRHGRPRSSNYMEYMSRSFDGVERVKKDQVYRLSASHESLLDLTLPCPSFSVGLSASVENIRSKVVEDKDLHLDSNCDLVGNLSFSKCASPLLKQKRMERSTSPETTCLPPI
ncbi:ankycorbin-like [Anneissia japonica]|uniref:ankycorbin-like n=1 Tax=Anneissia japonica TaxID=1529436 RepID=UPI00142599CE|nr:ankycorbin-like [Anneissia japonica]